MKAANIAILGLGVVGGGVADLVTKNRDELAALLGEEVTIKYILDKRDFPGSPYESLVTHSFDDILADSDVGTVVEVMGGLHPAYEFTVAALKAGKNVVSSNKEVVARYGDEFLSVCREMTENGQPVSYLFEASVGGGIPVIYPLLHSVRQNKIKEIRGILNGTTNYILTMMFTYGDSFEKALSTAQSLGYAERNPDADILGLDASRKIAILSSLVSGRLLDVESIPTEGITKIREADVRFAEHIGHRIKLLGRCVFEGDRMNISVSPFLIPAHLPLANVNGVYNAIEVIGEPIGNIMFFGQGAGAGATASAVVADIVNSCRGGSSLMPIIEKASSPEESFKDARCSYYIALPSEEELLAASAFRDAELTKFENECIVLVKNASEEEIDMAVKSSKLTVLSKIRFL